MELSLAKCQCGDKVKILKLNVGYNARINLINMGLLLNTELVVSRKSFFAGPLLLSVSGTEIALGRGLATKIIVEKI